MSNALPTNNLVIVGNGLSLLNKGRGKFIDSFDNVCRIKGGVTLVTTRPHDYGVGVDYICSTLKIAPTFKNFPIKEFWGYQNETSGIDEKQFKSKVRIEPEATKYWLKIYSNLISNIGRDVEPWYSTGMGAIVIAAASGLFDSIYLMGFDNLSIGDPNIGVNILREKDFRYPKHAFDAEHKMLGLIANYYQIPIEAENVRRKICNRDRPSG